MVPLLIADAALAGHLFVCLAHPNCFTTAEKVEQRVGLWLYKLSGLLAILARPSSCGPAVHIKVTCPTSYGVQARHLT